ncbi:MAG: hypothetical protein HRU11_10910 [Parvularculaceae bacterium]|nr:hypothetical protein [Parvularculaceae bacterium]
MTSNVVDLPQSEIAEQSCVFTICSKNYLPQARLLIASLRLHMPDATLLVFLADESDELSELEEFVGAQIILGSEIGLPTYYDMAMRYDITEFNTALKPFAFQFLFKRGAKYSIYLDPDIELMSPLFEVEQSLSGGSNAVLTPHITEPLDMAKNPTELKLIRTGIYNLGFLALSRSAETRDFLSWWSDRMPTDCRVDLDAGLFVDQKYIDLMPSYLPVTHVLRHPGYNVAYWNLSQRKLSRSPAGDWCSNGEPLAFMHYSGIRTKQPELISVHQNRLKLSDLGEGAKLFTSYADRLSAARAYLKALRLHTDYTFEKFVSGERIFPLLRQIYARDVPPSSSGYATVFDMSKGPYLIGSIGIQHAASHLISPVMADLWRRKAHLQAAFNIRHPLGAESFALWFAAVGHKEWRIDKCFIPQSVWELQRERRSLRTIIATLIFRTAELSKKTAFLYPKSVRRAAVRLQRRRLPALAKSIRGR